MTASRLARTVLATLSLVAAAAQAGTHQSTVTAGNGATATRTVQRSGGQVVDTTTGPQGNSRVRSVQRGAGATSVTTTGAKGATSSRATTRSA